MAIYVCTLARKCRSCTQNGSQVAHEPKLQLLPAAGPLEFVSIAILEPLSKLTSGNQHVAVIRDWVSNLTWTIPTTTRKAKKVGTIFLDRWVMPYGITPYALTDSGTQFVREFFTTFCLLFGFKKLTTTAYHLQTERQIERYNRASVMRFSHYVSEPERDWDLYVKPLTYS